MFVTTRRRRPRAARILCKRELSPEAFPVLLFCHDKDGLGPDVECNESKDSVQL